MSVAESACEWAGESDCSYRTVLHGWENVEWCSCQMSHTKISEREELNEEKAAAYVECKNVRRVRGSVHRKCAA